MDDYSTTAAGGPSISRGDRLADTDEWNSYIMVAESLPLVIVLLIAIACVLYADCAMRTAPNVAHWHWTDRLNLRSTSFDKNRELIAATDVGFADERIFLAKRSTGENRKPQAARGGAEANNNEAGEVPAGQEPPRREREHPPSANRALKLALLQAGSAWSRDYLVRMKRVVDMIPRLVTAIATALVVGTMTHKYAGLSLDTIRTDALSTAGVIFAAVACGSLLKPK
jgi:hypothetical protein